MPFDNLAVTHSNDTRLMVFDPIAASTSHLETKEDDPPRNHLQRMMPLSPLRYEHYLSQLAHREIQMIQAEHMPCLTIISKAVAHCLGQHVLAEFKDIKNRFSAEQLEKIILEAAILSGATVLTYASFDEWPNGDISAIVVIAESHFIMHYFPDLQFMSFDAFTCGSSMNIPVALAYISHALQTRPYDELEVKRGIRQNADDRFVKGIGAAQSDHFRLFKTLPTAVQKKSQRVLGRHAVVELNFCDQDRINDGTLVLNTFNTMLKVSGAPATSYRYVHLFHRFGVTAVKMGSRSHLTTHNWPEFGYTAMDVLTFNRKTKLCAAVQEAHQAFKALDTTACTFARGVIDRETKEFVPVLNQCALS